MGELSAGCAGRAGWAGAEGCAPGEGAASLGRAGRCGAGVAGCGCGAGAGAALAGGVGVGAGVGAAFALGQLRATFATGPRLEKATGMPVIGSIGEVVTRIQADQRAKRLKLFLGGVAGLAAAYVLLLGVEVLQRGMAA